MIKKGLGKGLSALLSIYDDENEEIESASKTEKVQNLNNNNAPANGVEEIEISLIDTNPNQPRKIFDKDALAELSERACTELYGIRSHLW